MKKSATPIIPLSTGEAQKIAKEFWEMAWDSKTTEALELLEKHPWLMKKRAPERVILSKDQPFLHAAFLLDQPELAAYGIAHGAPLEDRCYLGNTALQALFVCIDKSSGQLTEKFRELIDPMFKAGARCDAINFKGEPVWVQALSEPLGVWQTLIDRGSLVDVTLDYGQPGLSFLINHPRPRFHEMAKYLVRRGADVNLVDRKVLDKLPLMTALHNDNVDVDVADFLLEHGASIHLKDLRQRSLLHLCENEVAVKWLVENGLDLEITDAFGKTPLLHVLHVLDAIGSDNESRSNNFQKAAMTMILAGADLNTRDRQETSLSAREFIASNKKSMPELNNMLRSFEAREVAMQSLAEMTQTTLSTHSP